MTGAYGDATARVAKSAGEGIRSAYYVLVEKPSAPDLARDKRGTQNAYKESEDDQACGVLDGKGEGGWNSTRNEGTSKNPPGAESVTQRATDHTDYKSSSKGQDVGVCNFVLAQMQIGLDGFGDERRPSVPSSHGYSDSRQRAQALPRHESNHESPPGKEEDPSIYVEWVQGRYRPCLFADWVKLRGPEEDKRIESHSW